MFLFFSCSLFGQITLSKDDSTTYVQVTRFLVDSILLKKTLWFQAYSSNKKEDYNIYKEDIIFIKKKSSKDLNDFFPMDYESFIDYKDTSEYQLKFLPAFFNKVAKTTTSKDYSRRISYSRILKVNDKKVLVVYIEYGKSYAKTLLSFVITNDLISYIFQVGAD